MSSMSTGDTIAAKDREQGHYLLCIRSYDLFK